jgi:hypothetical protein
MKEERVKQTLKRAKIAVKKEDYRFGIRKSIWLNKGEGPHRVLCICNCGQHLLYDVNDREHQCDNCGNDYFVLPPTGAGPRFVIPYLESYRRDNRGFKVKRTNLSVIYTGYELIPVQENLTRTMEYDMVDGTLKIWREEVLEFDSSIHSARSPMAVQLNSLFFTKLGTSEFLEFVSTDVNRDLYKMVSLLGYITGRKDNILKGLADLADKKSHYLQVLANAGMPEVSRFRETGNRSYGTLVINTDATKPHEILRVPKFFIPYLREDTSIARYDLGKFQAALKRVDANKFREIMSVVKDEGTMSDLSRCIDTIMDMHINYPEYSNLKKLVLYLFRETKMYQGFNTAQDAIVYLRDYVRMSRELNVEFDKYPKSLKKDHDLVTRNYNLIVKGRTNLESFTEAVNLETYQELNYIKKDSPYAIITPRTPDDLIREGSTLSHCIASYVKDVVSGKCKIVFLRNADDLNTPLISIEVRGFNIRQAKGRSNRSTSEAERKFISDWAKEKKLVEAYY